MRYKREGVVNVLFVTTPSKIKECFPILKSLFPHYINGVFFRSLKISGLKCFSLIFSIIYYWLLIIFHLNPLNAELNPICYLPALLGAHHFLHVSRIRVKSLTLRLLMSCIYGAPILDVSRSHTTTQHSR